MWDVPDFHLPPRRTCCCYSVSNLCLPCVSQGENFLLKFPKNTFRCVQYVLNFLYLFLSSTLWVIIPMPENDHWPTNKVVIFFFDNRLAFLLPLIPVCLGTQHGATLFCLPRLFTLSRHSYTNFELMMLGFGGIRYSYWLSEKIAMLCFYWLSLEHIFQLALFCQSNSCHNQIFCSQVVITYGSTYILVSLSIDRCDAIRYPMQFSSSCKYIYRTNASVMIIWF